MTCVHPFQLQFDFDNNIKPGMFHQRHSSPRIFDRNECHMFILFNPNSIPVTISNHHIYRFLLINNVLFSSFSTKFYVYSTLYLCRLLIIMNDLSSNSIPLTIWMNEWFTNSINNLNQWFKFNSNSLTIKFSISVTHLCESTGFKLIYLI